MSVRTQYYSVRLKGRAKVDKKTTKTPLIAVVKDVLFQFGQAALLPTATAELQKVLAKLKLHPDVRFRVEGHASVEGTDAYNQDLSERRARAVRTWLTTVGGLDAGRFDVVGLGEKKPLAPSNNPDGSPNQANRQKNRRVEIRQIKPTSDQAGREEAGKEYDVDVTPYLAGDVRLDDEDGLIQMLAFTVRDSALWTNAITMGQPVELWGGESVETRKLEFLGNIKKINPQLTETGEIQLQITAYGKEWFASAREPRDLIYPSNNHARVWGQGEKLTATAIVKHLAQDAGLKIGNLNIKRDITFTRKNPVRQHHQTDWAFLQELCTMVHATAYLKMTEGENKLYVEDNTSLVKNVGSFTFYWPLRENGEFVTAERKENQIQFASGNITLDPDTSDTGVGSVKTKVDPVTGEDKVVKEEYNKETKSWEDWVLDEAALRRLPEAQRDAMIDSFLGGNLTWEDVKPYFRRAELGSESSRIPEDNWRDVLWPSGDPTAVGVGSTSYAPVKGPLSTDAANWQLDTERLRAATPEERSRILSLAARQALTFDNANDFNALQYFRYVPVNTTPAKETPPQKEVKMPTAAGKEKKIHRKPVTKRDAGFKIEATCYGNPAIVSRTSYVIEGLKMYSGTYYLYRLVKIWGEDGFMLDLTFVR